MQIRQEVDYYEVKVTPEELGRIGAALMLEVRTTGEILEGMRSMKLDAEWLEGQRVRLAEAQRLLDDWNGHFDESGK